ncbi:MAG: hypothetical protein HZB16_04225, partial [Armatimonadetes bacterium]|nr:hypothetical protein [Armatimonadota bacterium]
MRAMWLLLLAVLPVCAFENPLAGPDVLDPAAFAQWSEGVEKPVDLRDGPRHVIYTRQSAPEWDGVRYGEGKQPGIRYLRLGFKAPVAVGTVLTRAGGALSVLRATATYPGRLDDDTQWLPATRLAGRQVTRDEANGEEYALWLLPPGTSTRALRFAHTAVLTDRTFHGWLGGISLLPERLANLAPQAVVGASGNIEKADKITNGSNDGTWQAWDTQRAADAPVISAQNPEWVLLTWARPVALRGLCALWAGIAAADAQTYTGPADRHPREAADNDWDALASWDKLDSQYPRQLGPNWMDFGRTVTTRAVRLRLTQVTGEGHPHLNGNTKGGRRTWMGELLALSPLAAADLTTAILPQQAKPDLGHPPIPVRFTLPQAGYVTLVIEGISGKRVRNLVADTLFPAGPNVVWWDGTDDLGRDPEAARHGIYAIPAQFVQPGRYRVRGLWRKQIDLRYEFPVYNSGNPVWETADSTGCWLTNHTPPSSALFLPADRSPNGKDLIYLGSYVAEGGHGLAWVDLDGRKQGGRGWIGGNWTGAPYLARDAGDAPVADTWLYAGSAWEGELRLTAVTRAGDKPVVKYAFDGGKDASALTGIAVRNGLLVAALPKQNVLLMVDAKGGRVLGTVPQADPRGMAFLADGKLLVLAGKTLLRLTMDDPLKPVSETLIAAGLEDPQHVVVGADGTLFVTDRGSHHQVLAFDATGKLLRAIGKPGKPAAGPYDPLHLNNPNGLTIDSKGRLWVAETDYQPKRVSVWQPDGKFVRAFYGPGQYGGGGTLDSRDPTRFYYNGMEFRLDWQAGTDQLVNVYRRPDTGDQALPDGYGCGGEPE